MPGGPGPAKSRTWSETRTSAEHRRQRARRTVVSTWGRGTNRPGLERERRFAVKRRDDGAKNDAHVAPLCPSVRVPLPPSHASIRARSREHPFACRLEEKCLPSPPPNSNATDSVGSLPDPAPACQHCNTRKTHPGPACCAAVKYGFHSAAFVAAKTSDRSTRASPEPERARVGEPKSPLPFQPSFGGGGRGRPETGDQAGASLAPGVGRRFRWHCVGMVVLRVRATIE